LPEQTQTDYLSLIRELYQRADERTKTHLTISLLYVALLHVVVEWKLFMDSSNSSPSLENMNIICRGSAWVHKEHIPMPRVLKESEKPGGGKGAAEKNNGSNVTADSTVLDETVVEEENDRTLVGASSAAPADVVSEVSDTTEEMEVS